MPEIVDEGRTGLLFKTRNVTDLVQKIQTLVADPALCTRLGEAGREKALRAYGEEVVAGGSWRFVRRRWAVGGRREALSGKR